MPLSQTTTKAFHFLTWKSSLEPGGRAMKPSTGSGEGNEADSDGTFRNFFVLLGFLGWALPHSEHRLRPFAMDFYYEYQARESTTKDVSPTTRLCYG